MNIKIHIKTLLNQAFGVLNLEVIRKARDLDSPRDIPLPSAQYYAGLKPIILQVSMEAGRTNRWFDLSGNSNDPAIHAIREGISKGLEGAELIDHIFELLKMHHQMTRDHVKNAATKLGIENESSHLNKYPHWSSVLPWDIRSHSLNAKEFPFAVKKNRASNGLIIKSNDPDEIMRINEKESLFSHAMQYARLTEKIKNNGFRFGGQYGYVTAELLLRGAEVRWKPGGEGNHRVAVAAALGVSPIPVMITKVIRKDEVTFWPNVISGDFDEDSACSIFDSIFDSKVPTYQGDWLEYTRRQSR